VARRHGEVSRSMFPGYPIHSITNGVHSATWTAPSFHALYDRYVPSWREDNVTLRYAIQIPLDAVWEAHLAAKSALVAAVNERANAGFDRDVFTLGFARRATAYKRPALLLSDPERLRRIAAAHGGLQFAYARKAHPHDHEGKALIQSIVAARTGLGPEVRVVFVPGYDLELAGLLTSGVDVWVNTPRPPHEASGTSGMKAAHNGVPMLGVLDGWWCEGYVERGTGWAIGSQDFQGWDSGADADDAAELYRLLEESVLPLWTGHPRRWRALMRSTIALNASFFNTQRMLREYARQAYGTGASGTEPVLTD
jgi:starch phosphorylase